jgi:hypothetical protein
VKDYDRNNDAGMWIEESDEECGAGRLRRWPLAIAWIVMLGVVWGAIGLCIYSLVLILIYKHFA